MSSFVQVTDYYCEKPVCMRCRIKQFARESVGLFPFCESYVREFELITKIAHAHNLHVKMLDFGYFTIRT